ncbi:MAG: hypothetical protein JO328_19540 [Hyphomicrobiales bacterium]|nr:hypothetical protein [Hyphomicrobiales bacterium]MBV8826571.1 hypothetical protein [Hyphomicrobiales bacterium]MBV9429232.1 hypothetical protein [Bradyrhizobiaceae bacterium]
MNVVDEVRQVLEQVAPQLQAEGYTVYLEPSRQLLPAFMEGYIPDAIALRKDKNLAIEVVLEGPSSKTKQERLKNRFEHRKDWELRLYYIRPAAPAEGLPPMGNEAIDSSIASVENLISNGQLYGATLIGWATFEALGRALNPAKFARPQTPARLIEILAADGIVTPSEADLLRRLAVSRNRIIHGTLNDKIDKEDLSKFLNVLRELRRMTQTT